MEPERIGCTDDVEICGWPLGLLPVTARLSAASSSSNMMLPSCTPTSTSSASSSCSDCDSKSTTTSFFPEKSTTLGTLIGIHSSSQFALVEDHSSEGRHRGRSTRHRAMLCSFLGCGGKIQEDPLSHYWDMDDRESMQDTHDSMPQDVKEQDRDLEDQAGRSDTYCHDESWMRSNSACRPSLRLILQHPSPISPWSAFNHLSHCHGSMRSDQGPIGSRLHHCWRGFCGKLSSSLAT